MGPWGVALADGSSGKSTHGVLTWQNCLQIEPGHPRVPPGSEQETRILGINYSEDSE